MERNLRRPRIYTWHIHGSYLYYLSQAEVELYVPTSEKKTEGYIGRGNTFPFGPNVIEVPAREASELIFDCIPFQTPLNFLRDQHEILAESQRLLPAIYLEH